MEEAQKKRNMWVLKFFFRCFLNTDPAFTFLSKVPLSFGSSHVCLGWDIWGIQQLCCIREAFKDLWDVEGITDASS